MKYPKSWKDVAGVTMTTVTLAIATMVSGLAACAQDASAQEMKPLLVVSLSGYDELIKDVNFLGELAGKPGLQETFEETLNMVTQGQGLAGLDKTRPWGVVVQTGGGNFPSPRFCSSYRSEETARHARTAAGRGGRKGRWDLRSTGRHTGRQPVALC